MKMIKYAVLALMSLFALNAFAQDQTQNWEISGGTDAFFEHESVGSSSGTNNPGYSIWSFSANVNQYFSNTFELGASVGFSDVNGNSQSFRTFSILAGPTFDFLGTPLNAFFVTAQAGVKLFGNGPGIENATTFAYLIGVGKRFEIVDHVSWKPEIALTGNTSQTDSATGFYESSLTYWQFIPLQLTVIF